MTFTLGFAPENFSVLLSAGSDFVAALRRSDNTAWPAGITLTLDFGAVTNPATPDADPVPVQWAATLNGPTATWDVDETQVALALLATKVRLWYVEGETRLLWASGAVKVKA